MILNRILIWTAIFLPILFFSTYFAPKQYIWVSIFIAFHFNRTEPPWLASWRSLQCWRKSFQERRRRRVLNPRPLDMVYLLKTSKIRFALHSTIILNLDWSDVSEASRVSILGDEVQSTPRQYAFQLTLQTCIVGHTGRKYSNDNGLSKILAVT